MDSGAEPPLLHLAATNQKFKGGTVTIPATLRTTPPAVVEILERRRCLVCEDARRRTLRCRILDRAPSLYDDEYPGQRPRPGRPASRRSGVRRSVTLVWTGNAGRSARNRQISTESIPWLYAYVQPERSRQISPPTYFADPDQGEVESGARHGPPATFRKRQSARPSSGSLGQRWTGGLPRGIAVVVVWAASHNHAKVMEGDWDAGAGGLSGVTKTVNGRRWFATLADRGGGRGRCSGP